MLYYHCHIEIHYTASLDLFSILLRLSMILSLGLQRNVLQYNNYGRGTET